MSKILQKNLKAIRRHQAVLHALLQPLLENDTANPSTLKTTTHSKEEIIGLLRQGADFIYFIGIEDGTLIQESARMITQEKWGMCMIETDIFQFLMVLEKQDFTSILRNRKVFWAIGESWKTQLDEIWNQTYCFGANQPVLFYIHKPNTEIENYINQEIQIRKNIIKEQINNLPVTLQSIPRKPLRIWCFEDLRGKQKYSLIQHVLIRTLFHFWKKQGCIVEYIRLIDGEYYPPYYRIIKLSEFAPNILFLCNKSPAYEFALGAELSRSLPIPKIIWHADDPVYGEHLLERYGITEDESHWIADYGWANTLTKHGAKTVKYLTGAATKTRRGKHRGKHKCDVVFVGQVRHQQKFFAGLSPEWKNYAEKVIHEKLRFPRKDLHEVLQQFPVPAKIELDLFDELKQKILWEANTRFRLHIISGLQDFDLRIYGNDDWLQWLPKSVAKRCFKGVLHYKQPFDVYRNACITLNIHSLQTYTCMNVRDFDVPVSGGCLVSDWLPKAEEIYQPGFVSDLPMNDADAQKETSPHVFFYRSVPELQTIANYFIGHEEQRLSCIERARQHVLKHHTYQHRAHTLKTYMESRLEHSVSD